MTFNGSTLTVASNIVVGSSNTLTSPTDNFVHGNTNSVVASQYSALIAARNADLGNGFTANAVVSGQYAKGRNWSTHHRIWTSGRFASTGDFQAMRFTIFRATTDATPTVLTGDGAAPSFAGAGNSTNTIFIPNDPTSWTAYGFDGMVVATRQNTVSASMWKVSGLTRGGSTGIIGSPVITKVSDNTNGAWNIDTIVTSSGANYYFTIAVTGSAATNIRWGANIELVRVSY
jgi:hypothetical protein